MNELESRERQELNDLAHSIMRDRDELLLLIREIRPVLIDCDSELSAQGHNRPASPKAELLKISNACRSLYERIDKLPPHPVSAQCGK